LGEVALPENSERKSNSMRLFLLLISTTVFLSLQVQQVESAEPVPFQELWSKPYSQADAKADYVLGYWSFDGRDPIQESAGRKLAGKLIGAKIDSNGKFGKCLESFPGYPKASAIPHRLSISPAKSLSSPSGAITLEMWIKPKKLPKGEAGSAAMLLDKKYVDHTDYQLKIWQKDSDGKQKLAVLLGFGRETETWTSEAVVFEQETWHHIAFTYDAMGTGSFFVDGYLRGTETIPGRGKIAAGTKPLSIGDRLGGNYMGFDGRIDQVRISSKVLEFRPLTFNRNPGRNAFVRHEGVSSISCNVQSLSRVVLPRVEVAWSVDGVNQKPVIVRNLKPGEKREVVYQFDTSLRSDQYQLQAMLSLEGFSPDEKPYVMTSIHNLHLVNRKLPDQYPVVMWGAGPKEIDRLQEIGFTHALGLAVDYGAILEAGKPVPAASAQRLSDIYPQLDQALIQGITFAPNLGPGRYAVKRKEWLRVDTKGKVLTGRYDNINGLIPETQQFCFDVGKSVSQTFGEHPAYGAALIHSEIRDHAAPSFSQYDYEAYRKATGLTIPVSSSAANAKARDLDLVSQMAIPAGTVTSHGVKYAKLKNFPKDRVIPDDHPIYVYYRWYWKKGDGWNGLNSQVVNGLREGLSEQRRKDFWTWNDPAVRVASVYGSGGDVDYISQWSYCYPEPIRIGIATDELLAMAKGADKKQDVMKMTQIICYRDQIAPYVETYQKRKQTPPAYMARWEREEADAAFPTLPPMMLREAFWTKFSRPIKGIMYHGWQSLVPMESKGAYRYTHPETQHELKRIISEVVEPLGPTMLHVPGIQSDVAYLESFASQMFARRGTWGWGHRWIGDVYLATMYAGLQPEMIYDETITQKGLDQYKVLFVIDCDVLTESVAKAIQQFQQSGGIVIGDDHTCPAIKPNIILTGFLRTKDAQKNKQKLQKVATQIRKMLSGKYARYYDSSSPEVIPYRRSYKNADYLFTVNDNREYGDYIGHHKLVMENGLPSQTILKLNRKGRTYLYDLVNHRQVKSQKSSDGLTIPFELQPCDGTVLLAISQSIDHVKITAPKSTSRKEEVSIAIEVQDLYRKPIEAVVPVELKITDASGRIAEFSGYYAAVDGKVEIKLDIAKNDPPGVWTILAKELASGKTTTHYLRVK